MSDQVKLLFEFRSPKFPNTSVDFSRGKILIGRSPVCDFVIQDDRVSSFHALVTFNNHGDLIIYDLESKNGIYFEDERVQAYKLEAGVRFTIADINIRLSVEGNLALALSSLQEQTREIQLSDIMSKAPTPPPIHAHLQKKELKSSANESLIYDDGWKQYQFYQKLDLNSLYYPLENKKLALDSLIFDDDIPTNDVEKGGRDELGLEVIVSIGGVVIDLKTFEMKKNKILLAGEKLEGGENEVFFPTIAKGETKQFLTITREGVRLNLDTEGNYHSFESDGKKIVKSFIEKEGRTGIMLDHNQIYCLSYENLQIYMRLKTISKGLRFAPVFGKDKSLLWQALVGIAVAIIAATTMTSIEIPVKKQIKREVAVIYKQTQNKIVVKKPDKGAPERKKAPPKKQKKPKKKPRKKPRRKKPTKKITKKAIKKPKFSFMKKSRFKSFASSRDIAKSPKNRSKSSKKIDFSKSADVSYADDSVAVDDFSKGKESSKWGKQGFGGKGGYRAAAFSKKTVVLGAIDPEAIRKALAKYLSQFRACYQEELDLQSEDLEGIFDFQFRIGEKGRVTKSSLTAQGQNFSQNGINCMKRVLGKIRFPKPKGGGVVDIKQTFNFSSGGV